MICKTLTVSYEFREIARNSKAVQKDVDELAKTVKKGRWEKAKKKLGL